MSERKDVWIAIRGVQHIEEESDQTELFTQGRYYQKNDSYFIIYDESEATGFEGCRTMLKIDAEKISLTRSGPAKTNLLIEKGKRNVGYYGTGQGEMIVGVNAGKVDVQLGEDGGDVHFSYSLDVNSMHVSDNEVYVEVKPLQA